MNKKKGSKKKSQCSLNEMKELRVQFENSNRGYFTFM